MKWRTMDVLSFGRESAAAWDRQLQSSRLIACSKGTAEPTAERFLHRCDAIGWLARKLVDPKTRVTDADPFGAGAAVGFADAASIAASCFPAEYAEYELAQGVGSPRSVTRAFARDLDDVPTVESELRKLLGPAVAEPSAVWK